MPPLPSTTQTLLSRLSTLSESNKATQQLIQRLAKVDFQPGTVPASSSEVGDVRLELSGEIHESLKRLDEELEIVRLEVEDVVQPLAAANSRRRDSARDSEKARLAVVLARVGEDLKASRTQFRKAQLAAKRAADRAKLKERELLFSSLQSDSSTATPTSTSAYRRRNIANSNLTEQEVIAGAASDITAALRRTQALMQSELSRSRFAQETLEQSTAALQELGEKYTDLNTLLSKSRTLVTTLLKSQKSDTWYLETTLYILLTTVIWLIFRRWLYGPITWFVVWPLKLVFRIVFAVAPAAGVASSSSSSSIAVPEQPSTSLIVKPSATGRPPKFAPNHQPAYVPVGAGGRGYHNDPNDPSQRGSLSQKVGRMAEGSGHPQLQEGREGGKEGMEKEQVVRGDGTVLPERGSDRPVNPKKKMWDEGVEGPRHEEAERERERVEKEKEAAAGARRKRDEL